VDRVTAVARELQRDRLMLQEDVDEYIQAAKDSNVLR